MTVNAIVNTLLEEVKLAVWEKSGEMILDKPFLMPRFHQACTNTGFTDELASVQRYVAGVESGPEPDVVYETLRRVSAYVRQLEAPVAMTDGEIHANQALQRTRAQDRAAEFRRYGV